MKLEDYLEGVRDCADELVDTRRRKTRLTSEFGIYDNFPLLVNVENYDEFANNAARDLTSDYQDRELVREGEEVEICFKSKNTIWIRKMEEAPSAYIVLPVEDAEGLAKSMREEYNTYISFHIEGTWHGNEVERMRELAGVIEEVSMYAVTKGDICMPRSGGLLYVSDLTRIVEQKRVSEVELMRNLDKVTI